MKKSIILSLIALMISVAAFAQPKPQGAHERKAPSVEEIAKRHADFMQKAYKLDKGQYDKVYKLYLKQAKKNEARMKQIKKEREQMNKGMKGILNQEQWAKYEKMQQRRRFVPNVKPGNNPGQMKKGPVIERPQGKKNNMYLQREGDPKTMIIPQ